jgi:hypothetical protein
VVIYKSPSKLGEGERVVTAVYAADEEWGGDIVVLFGQVRAVRLDGKSERAFDCVQHVLDRHLNATKDTWFSIDTHYFYQFSLSILKIRIRFYRR